MGAHRIVLVDDDAKVRQLVGWTLKEPEFEVFSFGGVREALARLDELQPDLILSDVIMPDLDGRSLLSEVKSRPSLKDVPFIFMSAIRLGPAVDEALKAGAHAFLVKPFPLSELRDKVRAALAAFEAAHPPPSLDKPPPLLEVVAGEPEAGSALLPPAAPRASPEKEPPILQGRFTTLKAAGADAGDTVQILTEARASPSFTITTVLSRRGKGVLKIEMSWTHPVLRREDMEPAQQQIDRQHEHALALINDLRLDAPRAVLYGVHLRSVDGALLAWAMTAIAEKATVDRPMTTQWLDETRRRLEIIHGSLRFFRVVRGGKVICTHHDVLRAPIECVAATGVWTRHYLETLGFMSPQRSEAFAREATLPKSKELESAGFYRALRGEENPPPRPLGRGTRR